MKSIIDRIFSTRMLALLLALCATGGAWADTLRVLGSDATICSSATTLDQSGFSVSDYTVSGTINFYPPAGCTAGDKLLFTKLEMLKATSNPNPATTITITVDGKSYTSGNVIETSAPSSLGNLTTAGINNCNLYTYNFPNVEVTAGQSYSVTFNMANNNNFRCRLENTASGTVFTQPVGSGWKPYGVVTVTKVLSSSPDVGDTILLSNTATSGTISDSGAGEGNISLTIPSNLGIPANSVVRIKKLNLASWNDSFKDWDNTNHKSDPYFIKINNIKSLSLQGTTTDPGSAPSINLQTAKIQGNATTSLNRLSFEYSSDCDLTVGTTYPAATGNNASTGVALLYRNGNLCYGGGMDQTGVRYVTADSASVLSSTAASGAYPIYEMYAEIISIPTETATISAAGTYTLADLFSSVSASGRYSITVNESATLNIDASTTVANLTFNVASGKTLTLTGSALTVDSGLRVTGDGYVNLTSATVSGTLKGDGTVVYTGTATPSGLVFTDNAWEGTLWLEKKTGVTAWEPTSYGSANSTIRMTGIQLYFNTQAHQSDNVSFDGTLEVTDTYSDGTAASYGIEINNGWSSATTTFGALKGTGTIKDTDQSATPLLAFNDASEFEGTINLSYNKKIRVGTSNDIVNAGELFIASGKSVTVSSGKTWTASGGFYVLGTLTLGGTGSTLSGKVSGSGTVVCNQVDLSGSGFDTSANYGWTGKVQIAGDTGYVPSTSFDEASYGNASSTLEVTSGLVAITTTTSLPGTVNVASGATLYMTSSSLTDLSISGTNNGTINLSMAGSLTTLTLSDGIARGTVVYPSSLTTLNVALNENIADDGRMSFTCGGATPTSGTLTLTRPDGTTEGVTGTVDGATVSFAWTPSVSGAAAWCAYEFASNLDNTGSDTNGLNADGTFSATTSVDGDGKLYTYSHPWRNITYPSDGNWSAMVRCTVPKLAEATVVTFGTQSAGLIGLAAGATPDTEMYLVQTTNAGGSYNSHYVTNAVMPVLNGTTAQHVYVFTVEGNQTVKIYCDNSLIETKVFDSPFTIGGGIQIGSVHGGMGSVGLHACRADGSAADPAYSALSEADQKAARVDSMRLYKGVLGANAIAQLSEEFPAVMLFETTISGGDDNVWGSLDWTGGDIININAYSKAIITVEDDATLTLPASITADELVFDIASGKTLTLVEAGGGTTFAIGHPVEVETGSVAFDASSTTLDFAIGGTGYVFVDTNKTISVVSGGSLSRLFGSGTVSYEDYGSLPGALTLGDWTGTVVLPSFTADGLNLNNYGKSGSTVELLGITGGWIAQAGTTVAPTLKLSGNMVIDAMSSWTYTFSKIDGTGNLSFSTSANSPTVVLTEVASTYSGTISSTLSNPVTITTLVRPADQVMTGGTKLLMTSGNIRASALTLGTTPDAYVPVTLNDGIYVKYGSSTLNGTVTYHNTVDDAVGVLAAPSVSHDTVVTILDPSFVAAEYQYAPMFPSMGVLWDETSRSYSFVAVKGAGTTNYETIAAAIEGGVTAIELYRSVTENVTLPVGTTITLGSYTLTGTVTSAVTGYEVSLSDGVYSLVDNTASTWTGEANDGSWTNGENWSTGFKPTQYTDVTFPAGDSTITLAASNGSEACKSIALNGNLTLQYSGGSWVEFYMFGGVSGTGTLTLSHVCLNNRTSSAIEISSPVVIAAVSGDSTFLGTGSWTLSGPLTVNGYFKAQSTPVTVSGDVTFAASGVTVETQAAITITGTTTLNGGFSRNTTYGDSQLTFGNVTVAASTAITGAKPTTFSGTVTLASGATLTVPTETTTVSGATFVTIESGKKVTSSLDGSNTIYAAAVVPIADDSEATSGYMENSTAVITNTTTSVTIPAGATSVDLSFSAGDTITLTSASVDLTGSDKVTIYATDANGAKTATDISGAFKVTAGANNTYTVALDDTANATVTVDDEEIPIKPAVRNGESDTPMGYNDAGNPEFQVKAIPGLWYAVEAADTLDGLDSPSYGTPVQATSATVKPVAPAFTTGTVKYYRIGVAPSRAALTTTP